MLFYQSPEPRLNGACPERKILQSLLSFRLTVSEGFRVTCVVILRRSRRIYIAYSIIFMKTCTKVNRL